MQFTKLAAAILLSTALAGCLQTDGERALAGAAAGALVADALDENILGGAAVGAAGGALCDDVRICSPSR